MIQELMYYYVPVIVCILSLDYWLFFWCLLLVIWLLLSNLDI